MVKRAKLNYINMSKIPVEIVSLECLKDIDSIETESTGVSERKVFEFEQEGLEQAFFMLSASRREILQYLYVEELTPKEISRKMNCSIGHIYNQHSMALRILRKLLGGDVV